jgi:GAF domain-containing protein
VRARNLPATLRSLFRRPEGGSGTARADVRIRILAELTRAVGSSLEGAEAAHRLITEAVTSLLQVERSILFIPGAGGAFRVAAASGVVDADALDRLALPLDGGAIGRAFTSGESVFIPDVQQASFPLTELVAELGIRSILAVPLTIQGEALGVITADTRRDGEPLGEADLRLLEVFGGFGALVASEARLIEELRNRNRELAGLFEVVRQIGSEASPSAVLRTVLAQAIERTAATSGSLVFVDPARRELVIRASEGLPSDGRKITLGIGEGITGWVAREGQSIRLGDVRSDPRYVEAREDVRSELAVPLRSGGEIIGVLNVDSDNPEAFSEGHQSLLEALADLAAARVRLAFGEQRVGEDSQA